METPKNTSEVNKLLLEQVCMLIEKLIQADPKDSLTVVEAIIAIANHDSPKKLQSGTDTQQPELELNTDGIRWSKLVGNPMENNALAAILSGHDM